MFINIFKKIEKKFKLYKENTIHIIALLPDGERLEVVQAWMENDKTERVYHDDLVKTKIVSELKRKGFEIPEPLYMGGMIDRYPYTAALIRKYNIAFIFKAHCVKQYYETITSFIPHEITEEQCIIINKAMAGTIDSICYDNGNKFDILDKPLECYVKSRMKLK